MTTQLSPPLLDPTPEAWLVYADWVQECTDLPWEWLVAIAERLKVGDNKRLLVGIPDLSLRLQIPAVRGSFGIYGPLTRRFRGRMIRDVMIVPPKGMLHQHFTKLRWWTFDKCWKALDFGWTLGSPVGASAHGQMRSLASTPADFPDLPIDVCWRYYRTLLRQKETK